jgi:DNA-binding winged helix-turn-helix (wHTH) protein/type II secretory pathway predicted ATPase ExeA
VIYSFAGHELDTDALELRRAGEPVHVEPQVLAVLQHLVENRDRLVTKMELLDEVWKSRFVSESALTSRIKSARAAVLDSGRAQGVIRTLHGRGYRFVAPLDDPAGRGTEDTEEAEGAQKPAPARVGGSALAGRESELDRVESSRAAGASGDRQAVFVTGEAGSGKTALLDAVLDRVDDGDGWTVLRGQCLESRAGAEAYFCLLDAWARRARSDPESTAQTLDRVAPAWLAQLPSLVDDEKAEALQRRVLGATSRRMVLEGAEAVELLADEGPVILAIEDLHWADDPSLDVLELLIQRSEPARLLILATMRPGQRRADELVGRMVAAGRAVEMRLEPLSDDAIDTIVGDWFDGAEVPVEVLDLVRRRSDGIPLFVNEMLRTWQGAGLGEVVDGRVTAAAP